MPKLGDINAGLEKIKTTTFQFSATKMDDLGATEYTVVTIVVDCSGSTQKFRPDMEKALKSIVRACRHSPRADNLMLRLVLFSNDVKEAHGFKLLANCNEDDYTNILETVPGGMTALYDAATNGVEATSLYGKTLITDDYAVNGVVFVITDGDNNQGTMTINGIKNALENAVKNETLESLVSVLVGVNIQDARLGGILANFQKDAGFSQYVEIDKADAATLAKLADFVSRSISSQSQALGSGGPSQPLNF